MRTVTRTTVTGLSEALENLKTMELAVSTKIVKKASRAGINVVKRVVQGNIYSGLVRHTGLLRLGLGVTVRSKPGSNGRLNAFVVERKISTTGKSKASRTALSGALLHSRIGSRVQKKYGAFYWRFLEIGVGQRTTKSGASRGTLPATGNVRASFAASSGAAIAAFDKALKSGIAEELNRLPKGVKK